MSFNETVIRTDANGNNKNIIYTGLARTGKTTKVSELIKPDNTTYVIIDVKEDAIKNSINTLTSSGYTYVDMSTVDISKIKFKENCIYRLEINSVIPDVPQINKLLKAICDTSSSITFIYDDIQYAADMSILSSILTKDNIRFIGVTQRYSEFMEYDKYINRIVYLADIPPRLPKETEKQYYPFLH